MTATNEITRAGNGASAIVRIDPTAPVGNVGTLKNMLQAMEKQIAEILPKHVSASRIIKSALVAVNRQPALLDCTQASFMKSMMEASELGLDPSGGTLGQGYLVPFNNKIKMPDKSDRWAKQVQFIPGYRGLCDLARRGGDVKLVESHVVYRGDHFEYELGTKRHLKHVPGEHDEKDEDITHVYAIAWLSDEEYQFEVMTRTQVNKIRGRSKAKDSGPWVTDFPEMARKTVIRRLVKYLPISSERLAKAIEVGDQNEFGALAGASIVEGSLTAPSAPKLSAGDEIANQVIGSDAAQQGDPDAQTEPAATDDDQTTQDPSGAGGAQDDSSQVRPDPIDTYDQFYEAMEGIAAGERVDGFDAAMKKLKLNTRVGTDTHTAKQLRGDILAAAKAGRFDWVEAKVK